MTQKERDDLAQRALVAAQRLRGAKDVARFCRDWSIGKSKFYDEVKAGRLRAVKACRKTLVLAEDEERWARSLPALQLQPNAA